VGVTMKMYAPTRAPHAKSCCGSTTSTTRAERGGARNPHYVLNFEEAFRRNVMQRFADDYALGRTPNPCVSCNNFVKLGTLREYAGRLGALRCDRTLRTRRASRRWTASLPQPTRQGSSLRPRPARARPTRDAAVAAGEIDKRRLATRAAHGTSVHDKVESQDICFVEGGDYRDVLARMEPSWTPRDMVDARGEKVAEHAGIAGYTVGQRSRIGGTRDGARYVTRIEASTNTIVIGREDELSANGLIADEVNLIRPSLPRPGAPVWPWCATARAQPRARNRFERRHAEVGVRKAVARGRAGTTRRPVRPRGEEALGAATIREAL